MSPHYVVTRHSDGWVIVADGAPLLLCSSRKTALRTIRDALAQEEAPSSASDHSSEEESPAELAEQIVLNSYSSRCA